MAGTFRDCGASQQLAVDEEKGLHLGSKVSKMRGKSRGMAHLGHLACQVLPLPFWGVMGLSSLDQ